MHISFTRLLHVSCLLMLALTSSISANTKDTLKALWNAIEFKNNETAKSLISKTSKELINKLDTNGWTMLNLAVYAGNSEDVITALIKKGANIDAPTRTGRTPLMSAIMGNRSDFVELLIKNGADVNSGNIEDMSPLHLAISGKNQKIIGALLAAGADANRQNKKGLSVLALAVRDNNRPAVELIVAQGQKLSRNALRDAQELAKKLGYFEIEYLLENRLEA